MRHKTQAQVGAILGIKQSSYCAYEKGLNEPSIDAIVKLCDYLDVSADWLLGRNVNVKPINLDAIRTEAEMASEKLTSLLSQLKDRKK